ncbi:MAG: hypothetical protein ACOY5F_22250 [Pseudomonadota bacterium]|jgi:hypothetical protein
MKTSQFTQTEILEIRHMLSESAFFSLTEVEQRACRHVLERAERGDAVEDFAVIVRHLLDATKAQEEKSRKSLRRQAVART